MSAPLPDHLGAALADGVELLRALAAGTVSEVRALEDFRRRHPGLRATVLVDRPPGSAREERDLHLEHDELGGVSLAWRAQDGAPWALLYADHWASQYVLSVNERPVTIREALVALRMEGTRSPDMVSALVARELISSAVDAMDPAVGPSELQAEVDAMRWRHGLRERTRLLAWLDEAGLTEEAFVDAAREAVRVHKWEDVLVAGRVAPRFAASTSRWERVTWIEMDEGEPAARLRAAVAAGERWTDTLALLPVGGRATVVRGFEAEAHAATAGGRARVIVQREPAVLDAATERAIRVALVREWVEAQRETARIVWYWR